MTTESKQSVSTSPGTTAKWVIIPVAIPGCGGGPFPSALEELFGFVRVQRVLEDMSTHDREDLYRSDIWDALTDNRVVIAEGYNHTRQDRQAIFDACAATMPRPKILALNWNLSSLPASTVHTICLSRLPPVPDPSPAIWRYIDAYAPVLRTEVDAVIDLNVAEDLFVTVTRLVAGLCLCLELSPPAESRVLQLHHALRTDGESIRLPPPAGKPIVLAASDGLIDWVDALCDSARVSDQVSPQITALVRRMAEISLAPISAISSREFNTPDGLVVTCWKIRRSVFYQQPPSSLPTPVRVLWTRRVSSLDGHQQDEVGLPHAIVARGYDKFYDVNEMPWTTWGSLRTYTAAPFYVTAMLPGCLIMISPLSAQKLLVTSKHGFGAQEQRRISHSILGEKWLSRHLDSAGKSPSELSRHLWRANLTLMCQLVDAEIEEFVVDVPEERQGLHLHGMNHRTVSFATETPRAVAAFAAEWGFLPVAYEYCKNIKHVEKLVRTSTRAGGSWNGDVVQALVVRTAVHKDIYAIASESSATSPYPPPADAGSTFFFGVPLNASYDLWYRFRKLTLAALAVEDPVSFLESSVPSPLKNELFAYQAWLRERLLADRTLIGTLRRGRGLTDLRKNFLAWLETAEGMERARAAYDRALAARHAEEPSVPPGYGHHSKSLVILVGLPGCGKTFISRGLALLFGFKHVESDALRAETTKLTRTRFLKKVKASHKLHDVVIADGRCHGANRRRKMYKNSIAPKRAPPRIVALNWHLSASDASLVQRLCSDRLHQRDSNIDKSTWDRVVRESYAEHEPLQDIEVNHVIQMRYDESLYDSLTRAANAFAFLFGIRPPSPAAISDALKAITIGASSRPAIVQDLSGVSHFAFVTEMNVVSILDRMLSDAESLSITPTWSSLHSDQLIHTRPQATISHPKMHVPDAQTKESLLKRCAGLPITTAFILTFTDIIFNDRILCARVRVGSAAGSEEEAARDFISQLPDVVSNQLHVVLARRDKLVAPTEASRLIAAGQPLVRGTHFVKLDHPIEALARVEGFRGR